MNKLMAKSHTDTEARYKKLRQEALRAAQEVLADSFPNVSITLITPEAISASRTWQQHPERRVNWGWHHSDEGYPYLKFRYPKRFEAATWNQAKLIGLALGRPTFNGSALRLDFIEKTPHGKNNIPLLDINLVAMAIYAELLNAKSIRITHPVNEAVKEYYVSKGFSYDPKGDFCERFLL